MTMAMPDKSLATVPDRSAWRERFAIFPREADWASRETLRYGERRSEPTLPNGDPPSSMLWGEDEE